MTAFYMFRLYFLTIEGDFRGDNKELQKEADRLANEVVKMPAEQQRRIVERWFPAHLELSDV